jgi:CheY-like chemotaxis protein
LNKKLPRPLRVLIIDDDKSFVDVLQRDANPHRIILDHAMSLEEAIEIMDERGEKAFAGIILDVICLKEKDQKVADESFLVRAKEVFDRKAPSLPKAILTAEPGHFKTLKPLYEGTLSVYLKGGEDQDRMFAFFSKESEKLENVRMISQYPEVFEVFEKQFLGNNEEQELIACLKFMDSVDPVVITDNLARLRRLQEAIYLALYKKDPKYIPPGAGTGGSSLFKHVIRHFKVMHLIEHGKIIEIASGLVHSIGSDHGTHVPSKPPLYEPTRYTVKMTTFAMLDLILWFKEIMENKVASNDDTSTS